MATNLLEQIKSVITPEIISKLTSMFGGSSSQISSAVTTVLPTMLYGLINKTSTTEGSNEVVKLINDGNFSSVDTGNLGSLLDGGKLNSYINAASPVTDWVFGNHINHATTDISKSSGLSHNSTSSVFGFVATVILSFLASQKLNASGLTSLLSGLKGILAGLVPAGFAGLLGWKLTGDSSVDKEEVSGSGFKKLLPWLLALLAAVIIFWWWKGCGKTDVPTTKIDTLKTNITKKVDTISAIMPPKTDDPMMDSINAILGKFMSKKLPNGSTIIIAEKGVENMIIEFIEDKTKLVDKETWFSFDRILFETNKANLRPSSMHQINNIVSIMNAYPNVEIKIGGYTDNTGTASVNKKLSQERADAVMAELVKLGIAPSRMKAEGYGDQFPVASNDTPEGRAKNRRTDIRITKK